MFWNKSLHKLALFRKLVYQLINADLKANP